LEINLSKKPKKRLKVGDLVRVEMMWSSRLRDWKDTDEVGIVVSINEGDSLDYTSENTFVTVLVKGKVLEEEYYEHELKLIE
jgi:hypothetical protein